MKKFKGLVFALMSFVVLLVGCDTDSKTGSVSDKLQIVTTLFPQYDFAKHIVGDKMDVSFRETALGGLAATPAGQEAPQQGRRIASRRRPKL
mgnify:CR=1 FL=1